MLETTFIIVDTAFTIHPRQQTSVLNSSKRSEMPRWGRVCLFLIKIRRKHQNIETKILPFAWILLAENFTTNKKRHKTQFVNY